jgi:L-amino acid N-acyltransferase YncA
MIPRHGLVAECLCDGIALDTRGGSFHLEAHGATRAPDRFGAPDGAFGFDGNSWLSVAPAPCAGTRELTVSVWVNFAKRDMRGWTNCVVAQDDGNDADQSRRSFQLSCFDGRLVWHRMIQSRDAWYGKRITPGTWYHIVAIAAQGEHRLYVDGTLQDVVPGPFGSHAAQPLHIGRKGTDESSFLFRGAIDDLRLYDRALGAGDVATLFAEGGFAKTTPRASADIGGRWGRDGTVYFDLAHDGAGRVTGRIMAGRPSNMADVSRGTFDPATGRFVLEGVAPHQDSGTQVDFRVEGTVDGEEVATVMHAVGRDGAFVHHGNHVVSRRGARPRRWRDSKLRALLLRPALRAHRLWWSRTRPSKARNERRIRARGENVGEFVIRDATSADIPALSQLHVTAWNATYNTTRGPTLAVREWQWRQTFSKQDGTWFVLVVAKPTGDLVGFTRGIKRADNTGDFNKLYLLTEYQRLGLGRRLTARLAARFLEMGVTTMSGYVDGGNPSCAFFERIGGRWGRDEAGRPNPSWYVWDVAEVSRRCRG